MTLDCLDCGSKSSYHDAEFCSNCGASLAGNTCTDCEEYLGEKDSYCYSGGRKSTHYENGNIKPAEVRGA